ncbi:hypothetical protein GOODEAATRI_026375 [Goodea atripinnis]|uniref:Uncharacterized protein n=1 Tax=Goodea atripinnis TaxID=208336 RepID=A0ABV0P7Y1_9TELE
MDIDFCNKEVATASALLEGCYGELPSVAPRWLRGLGYLLVCNSAEPGLQFRHPCLQSYKNATFITRTIITKGVNEHLTQRAGDSERETAERVTTKEKPCETQTFPNAYVFE